MAKIPYTKEMALELITKLFKDPEKYIVAQQMSERYDDGGHKVSNEIKMIKEATGKIPAMLGFDLALSLPRYDEEARKVLAEEFIDYASSGGLVTFCAHFRSPTNPEPYNYRAQFGGDAEWDAIVTEGTEINKFFKKDLCQVADFIKILDDAGVPVLWRPLHEVNGNWFWFCIDKAQPRTAAAKIEALWRYIYKVFTEEYGMKNLIWVYSPNIGCNETCMYAYPGDDVVDIVALDWYSSGKYELGTWGRNDYNALTAVGKPFALGEFGPAGDLVTNLDKSPEYKFNCHDALELFTKLHRDGISFAWVLHWSSWAKVKISIWNMGGGDVYMSDPSVIDLEKARAYFEKGEL